jgi:hypothetical protein
MVFSITLRNGVPVPVMIEFTIGETSVENFPAKSVFPKAESVILSFIDVLRALIALALIISRGKSRFHS